MLRLYEAMIARSSYQGIFTRHAFELPELCRTHHAHLLVTEYNPLSYSSNELLNLLHTDPFTASIPLLLITVCDFWRDTMNFAGVVGVLRKPFTHTILLDKIQQSVSFQSYAAVRSV